MRIANRVWAIISVAIIAFVVLLAIFAPILSGITHNDPYSYHTDLLNSQGVPSIGFSPEHWFGVEPLTGRDLFSITVYGAQTSLIVGVGATILDIVVGIVIGILAGLFGGVLDSVLSKFTDFILLFPGLIFMIALGSVVPESFPRVLLMVLIIGLFGWGTIARVVRSEVVRLKNESFVQFSMLIGGKKLWIIIKHLLPNLVSTIIIFTSLSLPSKISAEAALSFLGVGITPPTPSWGRVIADAVNWINVDPFYLLFPSMFLFLITLAFNVLGDQVRDYFDSNLKEVI